jgi:hypothetical protein
MEAQFKVSSTSAKKTNTLEHFDMFKVVKEKNRLRWEYFT